MGKENKCKLPESAEEIHVRFNAYWYASLSEREFPGDTKEDLRIYKDTFWRFMNSNPKAKPYAPASELPKTRL